MILKHKDDVAPQLAELERILSIPTLTKLQKEEIEEEIWLIRAGNKGEKEAAYHLDFGWKDRDRSAVIHDLRIEHKGRVAQIDHLIINGLLRCHVLESKGYSSQVRISEDGEWETRTRYGWKGIPSPIEQNRRHIEVLKAFIDDNGLAPKRLGFTMPIDYANWVLVAPGCTIRRAGDEWKRVVKMDMFEKEYMKEFDQAGAMTVFTSVAKMVSGETVRKIAEALVAAHKPASFDFAARFGIPGHQYNRGYETPAELTPEVAETADEYKARAKSVGSGVESCEACGNAVTEKVLTYCRANAQRFSGKVLCQSCQSLSRQKCCAECGTAVDAKVVAFCRFNSKRFAKRLLCRECQLKAA